MMRLPFLVCNADRGAISAWQLNPHSKCGHLNTEDLPVRLSNSPSPRTSLCYSAPATWVTGKSGQTVSEIPYRRIIAVIQTPPNHGVMKPNAIPRPGQISICTARPMRTEYIQGLWPCNKSQPSLTASPSTTANDADSAKTSQAEIMTVRNGWMTGRCAPGHPCSHMGSFVRSILGDSAFLEASPALPPLPIPPGLGPA